MLSLSDLLIKYILAPLIVEVIVRFIQRKAVDPEFAKHADDVFGRISTAQGKEALNASAQELRDLISQ